MSDVHDPDHSGRRPADTHDDATPGAVPRAVRSDRSSLNWLLVVPLIATLIPPLYNREGPALFDIPFFYWYQLAAIAIGVTCTLIVYRGTRD